ncbi:rod shape-determining protein [Candidatus Woesebacteria bacterium]|nr:rod shape-determining protein [Candidatus Woesebacteria bacterium]
MNSVIPLLRQVRKKPQKDSQVLSIDLGSTSGRVMVGSRLVWHEPSCIAIHVPSNTVIAVGHKAYGYLGKSSEQVKIVFPLQNGVVSDQQSFEQLLQAILATINKNATVWQMIFGFEGTYATLATQSPLERKILKESFAAVGLGRLEERNQLLAASEYLHLTQRAGSSYCIVQLGGQVTEIALVSGGKIEVARRLIHAGIYCTEHIQDSIKQKKECMVSWQTAELLKLQLAVVSPDGACARQKISVRGKNIITNLGETITVSNEEIASVMTEFATEILEAIQELFTQAPTDITTNCLENGLYMIGGSAQIKGLDQFLQKHLQMEVLVCPEPEKTIVRGLAMID